MQHAQQLGLHGGRNLADLVEQDGAAVRQFEAAFPLVQRAVNAPFSWPKNSLSIKLSGTAAQLTLMNGALARGLADDRARDQFLARAAFAWMSTVACVGTTLRINRGGAAHGQAFAQEVRRGLAHVLVAG